MASLIDRLDAVEARLDPEPLRRGRVIADTITVGVLAFAAFVLGWRVTQPVLLVALLLGGTGLARLVPFILRHRLRRERDRLTAELEGIAEVENRGDQTSSA